MYYSIPFSFAKTEQISQDIFVSFAGKCSRESSPILLLGCYRTLPTSIHLCSPSQYLRPWAWLVELGLDHPALLYRRLSDVVPVSTFVWEWGPLMGRMVWVYFDEPLRVFN